MRRPAAPDGAGPRVVVTGGAGFMGSAFAAAAARAGYRIVVFDALTYAGDRHRLTDRRTPHEFVHGDVTDRAAVDEALRTFTPRIVVHFAAESHVTRAALSADVARHTNVDGTRTVLDAAGCHGVPHTVHVSSAEVYGERRTGHAEETDPLADDGLGAYATAKRDADRIAQDRARTMPVSIVRPTVAFGPYQHPEKAVPRWICGALDGRRVDVWGDGSPVRQWVHVDDIADAIVRVARRGAGAVYNIGVRHRPEITNSDLVRRLLREACADAGLLTFVPAAARPGEHRFSVTTGRIAALGWRPGTFATQVRSTVRWYAANRSWWEPLLAAAEGLYTPLAATSPESGRKDHA